MNNECTNVFVKMLFIWEKNFCLEGCNGITGICWMTVKNSEAQDGIVAKIKKRRFYYMTCHTILLHELKIILMVLASNDKLPIHTFNPSVL